MPSSRRHGFAVAALALAVLTRGAVVHAQQAAQGFAVERFYPAAPGGGWFVMDALDLHGGLGGAVSITAGYAHDQLRVGGTAVVAHQAFADVGLALTYDRWRFSLNIAAPLLLAGDDATSGGVTFAAPSVDLASHPDRLSDARLGVDVRLAGAADGPFRIGAGAQLWVPFGSRDEYDTDDTFRAMFRVLAAGDVGPFVYAAQVGAHVRTRDDGTPEAPRGSELLFGAAAGARIPVGRARSMAVILGPEIFGATAFASPFGGGATALETLLTARIEGLAADRLQMRVKLAGGAGLCACFGAPEWRVLVGVEIFNHAFRH